MEFSRQQYWSELPFSSPEDLPDPGIELGSPKLQADALPPEPPGKPYPTVSHQGEEYESAASQVTRVEKNLPANAGDLRDAGLTPGSGRPPGGGNGNPNQYYCLGNLKDRGAWQAGYSPWGHRELGMTECVHTHTDTHTCYIPYIHGTAETNTLV